jgi:hypothetical protein
MFYKIYRENNPNETLYLSHSTIDIEKVKRYHKSIYRNEKRNKTKLFQDMLNNGIDLIVYEVIEVDNGLTPIEIKQRHNELFDELKPLLNETYPYRETRIRYHNPEKEKDKYKPEICGRTYTKPHYKRHQNTTIHRNIIENR